MSQLSIEHFEHLVQTRQYEAAGRAFFALLYSMDNHAGSLEGIVCQYPPALAASERELHLSERLANCASHLFLDEAFTLSPSGFSQLMCLQRWLSLILGCTAQRNADHIIRALCGTAAGSNDFSIPDAQLTKCIFLMTVESELPVNLDLLWQQNQTLAATLFFAWLSTSVMASPVAHQKREALLAWWPTRIEEATDFASWPLPVIHQVYMLCSYGFLDARHELKKSLNRLLRHYLVDKNLGDVAQKALTALTATDATKSKALLKIAERLKLPPLGKPTLLVVTEWFSPGFAVYRTHSMTLRALKDKFHLIGVGPEAGANSVGQAVFDEFYATPVGDVLECVAFVRELARRFKPDIVYYLGVGMFPHTVYLSTIRLAPIQMVSNGHGASTYSPVMDYFITDAGYISGQAAFGETILPMPPGVMQMIPNVDTPEAFLKEVCRVPRERPAVVKIAIAAAVIKINPVFISTLRAIADQSEAAGYPVEFHFPMAQAVGPIYHRIRSEIETVLDTHNGTNVYRRAYVYPHQRYPEYMRIIGECDLFLNPFPYGNTNGIADMALLGMPGICKAGPELAEHIDVGMFKMIGLPEWCAAWTLDAYIAAAHRMIQNHHERWMLSKKLIEGRVYSRLNEHQTPEKMGEILYKMCRD
jgi:HMW1C N-terminal/HMW1 domain 2